jgi:hypothetical protein
MPGFIVWNSAKTSRRRQAVKQRKKNRRNECADKQRDRCRRGERHPCVLFNISASARFCIAGAATGM